MGRLYKMALVFDSDDISLEVEALEQELQEYNHDQVCLPFFYLSHIEVIKSCLVLLLVCMFCILFDIFV